MEAFVLDLGETGALSRMVASDLADLTPATYTGYSAHQATDVLRQVSELLSPVAAKTPHA